MVYSTSSIVSNYRPISILSNLTKLFEIIVPNIVYPTVKGHIRIEQHEFVGRTSCTNNLTNLSQYVCEVIDSAGQVDVVYTDFQKTFDKVAYELLLLKLHNKFSFSKRLVELFRSYLLDCRQFAG